MAGFSMNKVLGTIKKRQTFGGGSAEVAPVDPANDTPEDIAARCVKQFCHSTGSSSGEDVIYLPSIVESAVASPVAAEECARLIRKFLHRDFWTKPSCQYNAIMLVRILADNPGPGFTRFIDKKFVDAAKELLRSGRDASVRQMLMETLDAFESGKSNDAGLALIIQMWKKEKEKAYKAYGGMSHDPVPRAPPFNPYHPPPTAYYPRHNHSKRLPDPVELANRLEEARTSAKLLEQVVACTPASEVLSNDLIKEFSDRCASASRSIQGYMSAENPAPDNDTMESLIDTNEQLQHALNQHQRAVLQARKQRGEARSDTSSPAPPHPHPRHQQPSPAGQSRPVPPVVPARKAVSGGSSSSNGTGNGKGKAHLDVYDRAAATTVAGPSRSTSGTPRHDTDTDDDEGQDPFRDPPPEHASSSRQTGSGNDGPPRLSFEPFHPGFGGGGGGAGGSSSAAAGAAGDKGKARPVAPVSDEDDDGDDVYRATPRGKEEGRGYRC